MVSKGDNKAGLTVLTVFAVGKLESALQRHSTLPGTPECQALEGYRSIQELEVLAQTGIPCCLKGEFPGLQRVLPKPYNQSEKNQQQQAGGAHRRSHTSPS